MTQPNLKQLVKLLIEWKHFIESGRHERPDARTDYNEAKLVGEPMYGEVVNIVAHQVKRFID
jgi:hypothetical protein